MKLRNLLSAAAAAMILAAAPASAQQLSIATGGTGGTYYPYGGGLAELITKYVDGSTAVAEVTGASVENMGLISRGDSDIAIGLADTVYAGFTGTGKFEDRKLDNVRALASIYPNAVRSRPWQTAASTRLPTLKANAFLLAHRVRAPKFRPKPCLKPMASPMMTSKNSA